MLQLMVGDENKYRFLNGILFLLTLLFYYRVVSRLFFFLCNFQSEPELCFVTVLCVLSKTIRQVSVFVFYFVEILM